MDADLGLSRYFIMRSRRKARENAAEAACKEIYSSYKAICNDLIDSIGRDDMTYFETRMQDLTDNEGFYKPRMCIDVFQAAIDKGHEKAFQNLFLFLGRPDPSKSSFLVEEKEGRAGYASVSFTPLLCYAIREGCTDSALLLLQHPEVDIETGGEKHVFSNRGNYTEKLPDPIELARKRGDMNDVLRQLLAKKAMLISDELEQLENSPIKVNVVYSPEWLLK